LTWLGKAVKVCGVTPSYKELSVATNSRSCFKYELLIIIADKKNYPS